MRSSLDYSYRHPREIQEYIKALAQEKDDAIIKRHIDLYVNQESISLSASSKEAIAHLFTVASEQGLLPHTSRDFSRELL